MLSGAWILALIAVVCVMILVFFHRSPVAWVLVGTVAVVLLFGDIVVQGFIKWLGQLNIDVSSSKANIRS
jgi:fatty acid desaturase